MTMAPDKIATVTRADYVPGPGQGQWTYKAYAALPADGNRYEVLNGVLYMSPSPNRWHQRAVTLLVTYLTNHVEGLNSGEVYTAPFDVKLTPNNLVQPDVMVVLKEHLDIVKPDGIAGAPDLIIEVSSPGTVSYDRREKQDAYALAGVQEYWIADPASRTLEVMYLEAGSYRQVGVFQGQAKLPSQVIPDLPVAVEKFFA